MRNEAKAKGTGIRSNLIQKGIIRTQAEEDAFLKAYRYGKGSKYYDPFFINSKLSIPTECGFYFKRDLMPSDKEARRLIYVAYMLGATRWYEKTNGKTGANFETPYKTKAEWTQLARKCKFVDDYTDEELEFALERFFERFPDDYSELN